LVFFVFLFCWSSAQSAIDSNAIDIAEIREAQPVTNCWIYVDSAGTANTGTIPADAWQPLSNYNTDKYIPGSWITKPVYLKLVLENRGDSLKKIYFIASNNIRSIHFYKLLPGSKPLQITDQSGGDGYQPFELKEGEKQVLVAKLSFTRRNFNYLFPQLISRKKISSPTIPIS